MANKKITTNDDLAIMIEKNQEVILTKLEGIVYRKEFEELETRLKRVEAKLGIQ